MIRLLKWPGSARLAGFVILLAAAIPGRTAAPDQIPESDADVQNRVFLRTAPNGVELAVRLLPGNTFEPATAYKTNRADYTRAGLPADQARLILASSDSFSGVYAWQTNDFLLTFQTPTNGTYELQFTIHTVPGVQTSSGPFSLTVGDNLPPRIVFPPSGGAFVSGQNISALSVGAIGFGLTYQWYQDGAPVAGATQSAHAFLPMGPERVGDWHVVVSNELGSVASEAVRIELATVPVLTQEPQPARGIEGGTAVFTAAATGGGLNYEWQFNGRAAGYPNSPTLILDNLTPSQAGLYSVRVFNNAGSTVSGAARLSVCLPGLDHTWQGRPWVKILRAGDPIPGSGSTFGPLNAPSTPLFTLRDQTIHATARGNSEAVNPPEPLNALVRWRDGSLATLVFTNTPIPDGAGSFAFPFYLTDEGDGAMNFSHSHAMYEYREGAVRAVLTEATPIPGRPGATVLATGSYARRGAGVVIASTMNAGTADQPPVLLFLNGDTLSRIADDTTDLPGVLTGYAYRLTEDSVNFDGTTIVFSTMASINGPGGVYRATTDGTIAKLLDSGDLIPGLTNQVVSFGDVDVEGGPVFAVVGSVRQGVVQNRVLKFEADGSAQVIGFGDFLVASGPRQVYFGTSGSIQRWTDGMTETVINAQALLGCQKIRGFYDVEAQGHDVAIGVEFTDGTAGIYASFGEATPGLPRILAQPQPVIVPETTPATFGVAVSGPAPITYQWHRDGMPIAGATGATYTILSARPGDVASYHVVATAGGQAVTSLPASLALDPVPPKPLVFVPPATMSVPIGSPAVLTVVAGGAGPLTYRWSKGTSVVAEGPAADLSFPATTVTDHGTYSVTVSNANGTSPAFSATLSVTPLISQHPLAQTVAAGGTASFSVAATGFAEIRYLWFKDSTLLIGQTNATLTIENVQKTNAGTYSVSVTGVGGGGIRSAGATLTVSGESATEVRLSNVALTNGQLSFHFPTVAGRSYEVQAKADLSDPDWSLLETVAGDGLIRTLDVAPAGRSGFIRVWEKP